MRVHVWVRELLTYDLQPELVILNRVDERRWQIVEQQWIARLGVQLTNRMPGGEGPPPKKKMKSVKMQIDVEQLNKLRSEAAQRSCSISQVVRDLVVAWSTTREIMNTPTKGK